MKTQIFWKVVYSPSRKPPLPDEQTDLRAKLKMFPNTYLSLLKRSNYGFIESWSERIINLHKCLKLNPIQTSEVSRVLFCLAFRPFFGQKKN